MRDERVSVRRDGVLSRLVIWTEVDGFVCGCLYSARRKNAVVIRAMCVNAACFIHACALTSFRGYSWDLKRSEVGVFRYSECTVFCLPVYSVRFLITDLV